MTEIRMICINCPIGCELTVRRDGKGSITVEGNGCKRGISYAQSELTNPVRTLTTTVKTTDEKQPRVSVKTSDAVPVGQIFLLMEKIDAFMLQEDCRCGEVIMSGIYKTIDLLATQDYHKAGGDES